jgi:hypothetical protein
VRLGIASALHWRHPKPGSRAAAWTSERAASLRIKSSHRRTAGCARGRKAAAYKRDPARSELGERGNQSRREPRRASLASEAIKAGASRAERA